MDNIVTMRQLLEVGVHFGHQTRRWNPKMKRYIYAEKNGIYIIDLQQTLQLLIEAFDYVKSIAADSGTVLFVGTKKQIQDIIENSAKECGMPYVRNRWLGGTLTNFKTISARTRRIEQIEEMERSGTFEMLPKTEVLQIKKEYEKLLYNMGGIREMKRLPDLMFVIDPHKEAIAIEEAKKIGIPVVAIVDTNCDPDKIDYVIPGNDDAIRSCGLITSIISEAVKRGRIESGKFSVSQDKSSDNGADKAEAEIMDAIDSDMQTDDEDIDSEETNSQESWS